MPQRNGQNPIRRVGNFSHNANQSGSMPGDRVGAHGSAICPNCKSEVPPKPGFRLSALKCPKCGTSMGKK